MFQTQQRAHLNCPNCGQQMKLVAEPPRPDGHHVFECAGCGLVYMTEDHVPPNGGAGTSGPLTH
jgi:predicted RNA-binding Zn-ribbon protein involved in translation (DUF1610 family)